MTLDDPVDRSSLLADVAVERHRVDAELLAELAHAQRLEAAAIGQLDGSAKDALAGERRSALDAFGVGLGHHLIRVLRAGP